MLVCLGFWRTGASIYMVEPPRGEGGYAFDRELRPAGESLSATGKETHDHTAPGLSPAPRRSSRRPAGTAAGASTGNGAMVTARDEQRRRWWARRWRMDTHWWGSIGSTVVLVGLVSAGIGADWLLTAEVAALSAIGLGFFYFMFPGGAHFGLTLANFLAIYACLFEFFREANFTAVPHDLTMVARAMPVLGFLGGCVMRRDEVLELISSRKVRDLDLAHLPRMMAWLMATLVVGAASFAFPQLHMRPGVEILSLLGAMGLVTLFVIVGVRDVITVMVDVSLVFRAVGRRMERLVMPIMAFTTFYGLLVVIFACLYRIADQTTPAPQFQMHGEPNRIGFVDALYYSTATISTLGIGDIAPLSLLVRALSGVEVMCGILMLLFGFSEIMRGADPDGPGAASDEEEEKDG